MAHSGFVLSPPSGGSVAGGVAVVESHAAVGSGFGAKAGNRLSRRWHNSSCSA